MNLPEEIVAEILSRNPVKNIIHCRLVCKRWHNILSEPSFADLHLSKSLAGLIVLEYMGEILKLGELVDEFDRHDISHDPAMRFDLGLRRPLNPEFKLIGSVNGLICIWFYGDDEATCICNPLTREYTLLPNHKYISKNYLDSYKIRITYGLGIVEASKQYKVVRIYQVYKFRYPDDHSYKSECEIFTLGTGTWRSLCHVPFELYRFTCQQGTFANGNLHWLATDVKEKTNQVVWTFNLENEFFQLSGVTPRLGGKVSYVRTLGIFGGCLCLCDNTSDHTIIIWVMKDYEMKECWSKEVVINLGNFNPNDILVWKEMVRVLKVLKDGTILMLFSKDFFFTYHPGNKTLQKLDIFDEGTFETIDAMVFVPSFISLKSFVLEDVSLF